MLFLPWHLAVAYVLDLIIGDPRWMPHPIRWIGKLIVWVETIFYERNGATPSLQRVAGCAFWLTVVSFVFCGTTFIIKLAPHIYPYLGDIVLIWFASSVLATRSLHRESQKVADSLERGDLVLAREQLSWIVSRDTSGLGEKDILRALIETVSENISDGIVAPIFYLGIAGPVGAMVYKAVNTMDSMVGYMNERYLYFGWFSAKADDVANWVPARLSGLLLIGAAACLRINWLNAWRVMIRDAGKMKSPNAGYPEASAAGALKVELGGTNIYFGQAVEKPTLGNPESPLTLHTYHTMVRLMYITSCLAFIIALGIRYLITAK